MSTLTGADALVLESFNPAAGRLVGSVAATPLHRVAAPWVGARQSGSGFHGGRDGRRQLAFGVISIGKRSP